MTINASDDCFHLLALRPRGCPRWLWFLSATHPLVFVHGLSGPDATPQVRWARVAAVRVPAAGAQVDVSYITHNWPGEANKACFVAYRGDRVQYGARWWPWQKPRLTIDRSA
jgi:hypothetical protein